MGLSSYGNPEAYKFPFLETFDTGYKIRVDSTEKRPLDHYFKTKKIYENKLAGDGYFKIPDFRKVQNNKEFNMYADLAASTQAFFEHALIGLAKYAFLKSGNSNFCIAGGGALNCVANSKLAECTFVSDLFIQPASNDAGCSVGAAYLASVSEDINVDKSSFSVYSSFSFDKKSILDVIKASNLSYFEVEKPEIHAAKLLNENNVIAWFQDEMELGPRALGNRSILGNPTIYENLERINDIKGRERWRPLSPSIMSEHLKNYVVNHEKVTPYMTVVGEATSLAQKEIPAAVHVDKTLRVQSVISSINAKYHRLIDEFRKLSGVPAVINTSFNLNGEPIVCSPEDALKTFTNSKLDFLIIDKYVVSNNKKNDK